MDRSVAQLVLTLFRNLLCIPDRLPTAASAADHLSHVKNELLGRFFSESVIEVLVLVAQVCARPPGRIQTELSPDFSSPEFSLHRTAVCCVCMCVCVFAVEAKPSPRAPAGRSS